MEILVRITIKIKIQFLVSWTRFLRVAYEDHTSLMLSNTEIQSISSDFLDFLRFKEIFAKSNNKQVSHTPTDGDYWRNESNYSVKHIRKQMVEKKLFSLCKWTSNSIVFNSYDNSTKKCILMIYALFSNNCENNIFVASALFSRFSSNFDESSFIFNNTTKKAKKERKILQFGQIV